jgi:hypothetical protein
MEFVKMEENIWKCKFCAISFKDATASLKANHSRWCKARPNRYEMDNKFNRRMNDRSNIRFGRIVEFELLCHKCGKSFTVKDREKLFSLDRHREFCSRKCSSHFGGAAKAEKYESKSYSKICFKHHKRECIICKENKIVAVHHYDFNHQNDEYENLIPMCPTHASYMHSKWKYLIEERVDKYYNDFRLLSGMRQHN